MFFHVRCGCAVVLEVHECSCVGSVVMSVYVGVCTGLLFVSPRVSNLGIAQISTRVVTRSGPMRSARVGWLVATRSLY